MGVNYIRGQQINANRGRFINADIFLEKQVLFQNVFTYCNNNPIILIDPDGYTIEEFVDKLKEMFLGGGNVSKSYGGGAGSRIIGGVPNPNGRKGGAAHQEITNGLLKAANGTNAFGESVEDYRYSVKTEYYISNINGYKSKRFGDISIYPSVPENNKKVYIFQVGRATVAGSPVAREIRAMRDIESKGNLVLFIPYNQ